MTSKNIVQVTDQNFEATVGGAEQLVLLDFWATWCAPCKMLRPVVEELAVEYMNELFPVTVVLNDSTPIFDPENARIRS